MHALRVAVLALMGLAVGRAWGLPANTLSNCEREEGFKLLSDGTVAGFLSNFSGYVKGDSTPSAPGNVWKAVGADSSLEQWKPDPGGLRTLETYRDFDLRFQFRSTGNSGAFYRGKLTGPFPRQSAAEYEINDDTGSYDGVRATGSVSGLLAADPAAKESYYRFHSGRWNEARIVAVGDSVEHWLNGRKVLAYRMHGRAWWDAYDGSTWKNEPAYGMEVPGDPASGPIKRGYLGFQLDFGARLSLRNIRVSPYAWFRMGTDATCCNWIPKKVTAEASEARKACGLRRVPAGIALSAPGETLLDASLAALDGRIVARASSRQGRTAIFAGNLEPGIYLAFISTATRTMAARVVLAD